MNMKHCEILLVEKKGCTILVYGEWHEDGHRHRGLICKVYRIRGLYIRCHPCTGVPLGVHTSLEELKKHLTNNSV